MAGPGVIHSSTQTQARFKIHTVQYQPTTRPIEDRFSISTHEQPHRLILGVYDGHGGAATAEHISSILPAALVAHPPEDHARVFRETDSAMLQAFARDHSVFRSKSADWAQNAKIVKSGCTALVLDVDLDTLTASFANAGDCRAVSFRPSQEPPIRLQQTEDLNAKTATEQERLKREHPGEDSLIVGGRLFGRLMSTRGFGDAYYKLPLGLIGNWQHRRYIDALSSVEDPGKVTMSDQYHSMFYLYRTPPYLTATPEVGTMELQEDAFVIMATDGLWDCVSSDVAVEIVLRGMAQEVDNLAEYLLQAVMAIRSPGDDVTILLLHIPYDDVSYASLS
ncbi:phosphatase 2C-like domain-containing protein [Lyophyllum atratum]|nr:phosphatase 2C-like domain-containing protein [Lyophyllum atratum]